MAENIDVNVNVNTTQANRNLDNLNNRVSALNQTFSNLRTRLGQLAIGAFAANTLRFADSMKDLSNATGIATANIIGFSTAVQANGGSIEGAQNALNRLVLTIGEAADGSKSAQDAFKEVGVTLRDLETLSEQEILQKTITGLNQISDNAKRATLQNELLGKSLRGVDLRGVAAGYAAAVAGAEPYARSIETAAAAQDSLERNLNNLRLAILSLLEPINKVVSGINLSVEAFKSLITAIASAYAAFKLFRIVANKDVFDALVNGIKNLPALLTTSSGTIAAMVKDLKGFANMWGRILSGAKNAASIFGAIGGSLAFILRFGLRLAGIFGVIYSAFQALKFANEAAFNIQWIRTFTDYIDKLLGKIPLIGKYLGTVEAPEYDPSMSKGPRTRPRGSEVQRIREIMAARQKEIDSVYKGTVAYKEQFAQLVKNLDLELRIAQTSEYQAEIIRNQAEVTNLAANARQALNDKISELDPKKDIEIIDALKAQIPVINQLEAATKQEVETRTIGLQKIRDEQDKLIKQTQLLKLQLTDEAAIKVLQDQIALLQLYGDELENANIALEVSQSLEQSLLQLREQELDLIVRKGQLTDEQFQREMAQIEALRQAAYKRAGEEIDAKTQTQQAQRAADEDATLGIKKYLDELEKGVTPAKQALDSVKSVFGNLDSALENFVRTGKFKFKDFALSVVQDLLLIQAKAALVSIFKGVLSGLGIFGLAEGGPAKAGQPYIVGEKGPELFVPQGSGTVVPNNQLGNKGVATGAVNAPVTNNYITNNISAIDAKGVAQLFAENRKTLLGSVKMAEREMPYMAR